jgi:hypothetical protein
VRTISNRSSLALDAVHAAIAALSRSADSDEKASLLEDALACEREIQSWPDRPPTAEQREGMMRRILTLNVAVARLPRRP